MAKVFSAVMGVLVIVASATPAVYAYQNLVA